MPRYLIERLFDQREDDMLAKSGPIRLELCGSFPDLRWLHSHIVGSDADGFVRTFCLYEGPNAERCREHGEAFGTHKVLHVHEIAWDAVPEESSYVDG